MLRIPEFVRGYVVNIARGLKACIMLLNPERIVIGGGVMRSAAVIIPYIQAYVNQHAWTPWGKVEIVAAQLGNDAGLFGAIPLLTGSV